MIIIILAYWIHQRANKSYSYFKYVIWIIIRQFLIQTNITCLSFIPIFINFYKILHNTQCNINFDGGVELWWESSHFLYMWIPFSFIISFELNFVNWRQKINIIFYRFIVHASFLCQLIEVFKCSSGYRYYTTNV